MAIDTEGSEGTEIAEKYYMGITGQNERQVGLLMNSIDLRHSL